MHIYRFKITSDDNDDFLRVIDIMANQTFEDFHNLLFKTCAFKSNELASFYLCDYEWRKKKEITLVDMDFDTDANIDDEFTVNEDSHLQSKLLMKNVKLNQVINDPHQKILYVFDFMKMITLNIELTKILDAEKETKYPLIVESKSELNIVVNSSINDMGFEDGLSDDDMIDLEDSDENNEDNETFDEYSF